MPANGLQAFFHPNCPIERLAYFKIPIDGDTQTGGMPEEQFKKLVASIKKEGLINPILIEDDNFKLKVQLGNNRIWAVKHLGKETIKAIVITKNSKPCPIPNALPIPLHQFKATMELLHPGDKLYEKSPYVKNILGAFRQIDTPANWAGLFTTG
jgi:hypothetical protein